MPQQINNLMHQYVSAVQKIYGSHLRQVILYGSYARGDYNNDSDLDIMILLDLSDMDIKEYRHQLTETTFNFNLDYNLEIKPIAKNAEHYNMWIKDYPFYANVNRDGVTLYAA